MYACLSFCLCKCRDRQRPESIRSPGVGAIGDCELLDVGARNQTWVSWREANSLNCWVTASALKAPKQHLHPLTHGAISRVTLYTQWKVQIDLTDDKSLHCTTLLHEDINLSANSVKGTRLGMWLSGSATELVCRPSVTSLRTLRDEGKGLLCVLVWSCCMPKAEPALDRRFY